MYKYEMIQLELYELQSRHGMWDGGMDGQKDGRTDGQTDGVKPIYSPTTSLFGGYNYTTHRHENPRMYD